VTVTNTDQDMPSLKRKRIPQNPYKSTRSVKAKTSTMSVNRIPRTMREFPKEMRVKLKYFSMNAFTVNANSVSFTPWRVNSIYDPDALVGGSQPRGSSQWANFYQKYTVVGAKISIRNLDPDTGTSTAGTYNGLMGICIKDSSAPVGGYTLRDVTEETDAKTAAMDSYHPNTSVSLSFNSSSYFGIKNLMDNNQLSGLTGGVTTGTNPLDQAYFIAWGYLAQTSGTQVLQQQVMIEYDVIFSDPKDLTAS